MRYVIRTVGALTLLLVAASSTLARQDKFTSTSAHSGSGDQEIGGKTLDQWLKWTAHRDPAEREKAVRIIAQFGMEARKRATKTLIHCTKDQDAGVSANAIVTLQAILGNLEASEINQADFDELMKGLTNNLKNGTAYARIQAAIAIASIGQLAKNAIPILVQKTIKESYSWEIRRAGAMALGRISKDQKGPDQRAIGALLAALKEDICADVRLAALSSLAELGVPVEPKDKLAYRHALEFVISEKFEKNKVILIWSRMLLVQLETEGGKTNRKVSAYVDYVANQLEKDTDYQTRMHAAMALGTMGAPAKSKSHVLIAALRDPHGDVCTAAVASLGRLKAQLSDTDYTAMVKLLAKAMPYETRSFAAQALGTAGAVTKIPLLIDLLSDEEEPVGNAAGGALAAMKDDLNKSQLDAIASLLGDKNAKPENRCRAARALGMIGAKSKIQDLVEALKDKESSVASCAVFALAAMKDQLGDVHISALAQLLNDKEKRAETRSYAAQALGLLKAKAKGTINDLIAALKEKDVVIVVSAALALGEMGKEAKSALPALNDLKTHRDTTVKEAAAKAMDDIMGVTKKEKEKEKKAEDKQ